MRKKVRSGIALLLAVLVVNGMTISAAAFPRVFTVAVNNVRLRETAGLDGRVIAYLGQGDRMFCFFTTGVIDGQLWRQGVMTTRDVAGIAGYASAAYLK